MDDLASYAGHDAAATVIFPLLPLSLTDFGSHRQGYQTYTFPYTW